MKKMAKTIGIGYAKRKEMLFLALDLKFVNQQTVLQKIIKYSKDVFESNSNLIDIFQNDDLSVPFLITLEHLDSDSDKFKKDNIGHLSFSMNIQTPLKTNKIIEALKAKEFEFLKKDLIESVVKNGKYETVFDDTYQTINDIDNFKDVFVLGKAVEM